ncbi:MAG: hypothetical protein IKQ45_03550 [Clostridia bacterium]|nr:hypothetical protein [Clostridia bacterium]
MKGCFQAALFSFCGIAVALIMYAWRNAKQKKAGQLNLAEQRAVKS